MKEIEKKILDEIEPLLQSMGISLVEINAAVVNRNFTIRLVIFQEKGIALADCEAVHRVIKPRLELILESRDPSMEITSPGIDRKIKSGREYAIFQGRAVRVLLEDASDWIGGRIKSSDGETLVLTVDDEERDIPVNTIKKAKLDYTMEAR